MPPIHARVICPFHVNLVPLLAAPLLAACVSSSPPPPRAAAPGTAIIATTAPPAGASAGLRPAPDLHGLTARTLSSISPDRVWFAEAQLASIPGEVPYEYERVTLSRTDQTSSWVAYEQLREYGGLGWGDLSGFTWSADGRYLYFKHIAASDGCGYPFTTELHRVDLAEQRLSPVPLTDMLFGEIAISPAAERMAYRVEQGILLVDLPTGDSRRVGYIWPDGFGYLVAWNGWSPDGEELAFNITSPLCDSPEPARSALTVIDLVTGRTRTPDRSESWVYLLAGVVADPVPTGTLALHQFLSSLYWGARGGLGDYTYERAAALYGGSYETLIDLNPELDPQDHIALLRNACEVNGYQCLRLREVIYSSAGWGPGGAQVVSFNVYLADPDGRIFELGPCCGEQDGLPQTRFSFTVREAEDGTFKVLELPPYVP